MDRQVISMRKGVSSVVRRRREPQSLVMLDRSTYIGDDEDRFHAGDARSRLGGVRSCLTPLPGLQRAGGLAALPLLERAVFVVEAEVATGEPPLYESPQRGSPAPTVGIARAHVSMRVVETRDKATAHVTRGTDSSSGNEANTISARASNTDEILALSGCHGFSFSRRRRLTTFGSALPPVSFITWPTKKPRSPCFPPLYSAT